MFSKIEFLNFGNEKFKVWNGESLTDISAQEQRRNDQAVDGDKLSVSFHGFLDKPSERVNHEISSVK